MSYQELCAVPKRNITRMSNPWDGGWNRPLIASKG